MTSSRQQQVTFTTDETIQYKEEEYGICELWISDEECFPTLPNNLSPPRRKNTMKTFNSRRSPILDVLTIDNRTKISRLYSSLITDMNTNLSEEILRTQSAFTKLCNLLNQIFNDGETTMTEEMLGYSKEYLKILKEYKKQ